MNYSKVGRLSLLSIAAFVGIILMGCANAMYQGGQSTGSITVSVSSPTRGSRSIVPGFAGLVDSLSVTVSATGQAPRIQTASGTAGSVSFIGLSVAAWTIDVQALHGGSIIGSGSATVEVTSGSTSSVVVPLVFSGFSSGSGSMSIQLAWPSSAGVDYLAWSIDGGATTAATIATASGTATATIAALLGSGAHSLSLVFRKGGAGGAIAGVFIESVNIWNGLTSGSWIDGSGAVRNSMSFSAEDFLDSDDNLGGLAITDANTGSAMTIAGFSSSGISYDLYELPASMAGGLAVAPAIVFTATESMAGQYISYAWNGGPSTGIASGNVSAALTFAAGSFNNTLAISVRAPNRITAKVYTITWHSGAVTVGIGAPTYRNLTFSSSSITEAQGTPFQATCSDPTLAAVMTGWTWYIDGIEQVGLTTSSFALDGAATSQMIGGYSISCTMTYEGVAYSGGFLLTIVRSPKGMNS